MREINLDEAGCIGNKNGEAIYVLKEGETVAVLNVGDTILRRNGLIKSDKLVSIDMRFTKTNQLVYGKLAYKYPLLNLLMEYIQYQTGKLVYRNNVTLNRKNLAKVCGISSATINRQLKGLIEEDVIKVAKEGRNSVFFMNPYVVHVGKKVYESLVEMFSDTKYRKTYSKMIRGDKNV